MALSSAFACGRSGQHDLAGGSACSCSDKAFFRPKLISEQNRSRRERELFSPEPGFWQKSPDVRVLAKMIADRFCCHRPGFGVIIAEPIGKLPQKVFTASPYVERFIAASQSSFRFFQNQRCRTGTPRARNFLRRVLNRCGAGYTLTKNISGKAGSKKGQTPHRRPLAIELGQFAIPTNLSAAAGHHRRSHGHCRRRQPRCTQAPPRSSFTRTNSSGCELNIILSRILSLQPQPWSTSGLGQDWPGVRSARPVRFTYASASSRRLPASSSHDLLESPFVERSHSLMSEFTRTRARSSMIGIGSCLRCCSSRVAACPPVIFTASSPPAA